MDECERENGGCADDCFNTVGSFMCKCSKKGFRLAVDGTTCEGTTYVCWWNMAKKEISFIFFLILALRLGRYIVWLWCTCYRGVCRLWCCCKSSSYHFFPTLGCLPFAWVSHLGMIEKCYPHRSHKKNNVDQTKFLNKLLDKSRMICHSCINFWEYKINLFIFCKWDLYMCKLNEKESNLFCF